MKGKRIQVGIVGASACDQSLYRLAERVGELVGRKGWILLCGGLGGVMEASAKGARKEGALTVGILPGTERGDANPYIEVALPTDMGHARNTIIARAADALIAVGGGYGTLSEIALARKMGKKVVSLSSWDISPEVTVVGTPEEALEEIEKSFRV